MGQTELRNDGVLGSPHSPGQQPHTSKTGAVCTGAMLRKFPNLVHLGDALTPFLALILAFLALILEELWQVRDRSRA